MQIATEADLTEERMCRAMCAANGHDPDEELYKGGDPMPQGLPRGMGFGIPRWRTHIARAREVRVMVEAMQPSAPADDYSRTAEQERDRIVAIIREHQDGYLRLNESTGYVAAFVLTKILDQIVPPVTQAEEPRV